jgi:hypothetical protein
MYTLTRYVPLLPSTGESFHKVNFLKLSTYQKRKEKKKTHKLNMVSLGERMTILQRLGRNPAPK